MNHADGCAGVLKISPACLAAGVGLPVSVACRNFFAGGRVEADASVPWVDVAAPEVGCVLVGEVNVSFLFGLGAVRPDPTLVFPMVRR